MFPSFYVLATTTYKMMPFRIKRRRSLVLLLTICCSFFLLNHLFGFYFSSDADAYRPVYEENNQSCVLPKLDPSNPEINQYFSKLDPINCPTEPDWVVVKNGTFVIVPPKGLSLGDISCSYHPILRGEDDFKFSYGTPIPNIKNGSAIVTDFFRVQCKAKSSDAEYRNIHVGISSTKHRLEDEEPVPLPDGALGMNILMIGFDSSSRMTWHRTMHKTLEYFTNMGGIQLEGYNIVGDGTPQALMPILTGKNEFELPESRRGHKGAKPVDQFPWIWKELKKLGYVTMYAEDHIFAGAFTHRALGFKEQPTDHYVRHLYQAEGASLWTEIVGHAKCYGSTPRHEIQLNWAKDLFLRYPNRRKFAFSFQSELTHWDCNNLQLFDDHVYKTLKELNEGGYLDNTMLILMGDHGARYSHFRGTEQGKLEERMPMMSFRFPPWFVRKYPESIANLQTNAKRFATPFDIHETFMDIVDFKSKDLPKLTGRDKLPRGISLLREIPEQRTCAQAAIEPHWCACLNWNTVAVDDVRVKEAAYKLVGVMNGIIEPLKRHCEELKLDNILKAVKFTQNPKVLKFKGAADFDGYKPDLSAKTSAKTTLYQLTFTTMPGSGQFEATVKYFIEDRKFVISPSDISRINKYGSAPDCVAKNHPHARAYCYCKNQ